MLAPADATLALRDHALPGLTTLLDADRVAQRVRDVTGITCAGCQLDYIRYKPHTNCLAGYRFDVGGDVVDVHARAHRPADRDKLDKQRSALQLDSLYGRRFVLEPELIEIAAFPSDRRLPSLLAFADAERRADLLQRVLPNEPSLHAGTLTRLAYRPERRWVGRLTGDDERSVVVKAYTHDVFDATRVAAKAHRLEGVRVPRLLGHSRRHALLLFDWLDGMPLTMLAAGSVAEAYAVRTVGETIARVHARKGRRLPQRLPAGEAAALLIAARDIGVLCPQLVTSANTLAHELAQRLMDAPLKQRAVHGDLHAGQILLSHTAGVTLLDFDRAASGDPAIDVGSLLAHWERDYACCTLSYAALESRRAALLAGYEESAGAPPPRVELYTAATLLRLAPELFRRREPDWSEGIARVIARCEQLLRPAVTAKPRIMEAS